MRRADNLLEEYVCVCLCVWGGGGGGGWLCMSNCV